jgi:hypothetical protein
VAAFAALALTACDLDSNGPGEVSARVTGDPALGAVVLDVTWRGVEGFSGRGSTQVYSAPVAGSPDRHRVILVDGVGGELPFGIDVQDLRVEVPTVTIVAATDTDNQPVPVGTLRVRLGG